MLNPRTTDHWASYVFRWAIDDVREVLDHKSEVRVLLRNGHGYRANATTNVNDLGCGRDGIPWKACHE
jgi:hypothetical protein